MFEEHAIRTTGDAVQDRRLADIGGKGLFAKEIHEALADGRIDFAVHSLKDLETELPAGIVARLHAEARGRPRRADPRRPGARRSTPPTPSALPAGGRGDRHLLGPPPGAVAARAARTCGSRMLRGNVQTRLDRVPRGDCAAIAAGAGRACGGSAWRIAASLVLDPEAMVPAAGQGIVGVTVRADDTELRELLAAIEDREAKAVSTAERALLAAARRFLPHADRRLRAAAAGRRRCTSPAWSRAADGSFLLKRSATARRRTRRGSAPSSAPACGPIRPPDIFA